MTDPLGEMSPSELMDLFARMQEERLAQPPGWVHPRARPPSRRSKTVHQMKVTLREIKPPIWRRIVIPSTYYLDEVAALILRAMGWSDTHLHAFYIGDRFYDQQYPDGPEGLDERQVRLRDVFDDVGTRMRFEYDFGDGWEHDVVLEAIRLETKAESKPRCIGGRRACPPEDCGGVGGYEHLLEVLDEGPASEFDRDLLDWLPGGFDPEHFEQDEATEAMLDLLSDEP